MDPVPALAGLPVGHPPNAARNPRADLPHHGLAIRQVDRTVEMHPACRHRCSSRLSVGCRCRSQSSSGPMGAEAASDLALARRWRNTNDPHDERASAERSHAPEPEAGTLPSGRIARTARVGGLVASQSLRWAGVRTANRVRSPDRAAAANARRTAATVDEIVEQLSRMRGAAMKVGQMLSMVEFDELDDDERERLQARLAELRDDVAPVSFGKLEKLITTELGGPLQRVLRRVRRAGVRGSVDRPGPPRRHDRRRRGRRQGAVSGCRGGGRDRPAQRDAAAAAGQAVGPRARRSLADGRAARADRRRTRLRVRSPEPAPDRAVAARPSVHARAARLDRAQHPPRARLRVPGRASASRPCAAADEQTRDRYGEIVFRFFFGLLYRDRIALGDPHPGNYLWLPDGSVGFFDFGLLRTVDERHLASERAIARAVRDEDAPALKRALVAAGYLPVDRADAVDDAFALRLMRGATALVRGAGRASILPERPPSARARPPGRAQAARARRSARPPRRRSTGSRSRPSRC